jgi:hypothetical protein
MKKITLLALCLLLFSTSQLFAQTSWQLGGNTVSASQRLGTNNSFSLIFETNSSDRGRITSGGNWGIGLSDPLAKLHINSTVSSQVPFRVDLIGSPRLVVNGAGLVGINTTVPQKNLHVEGNEILSTGVQAGFQFRNRGSSSVADDWVWYSQDNIARFWRAGYGDMMGITTAGNVGIGTLNPAARFEVNRSIGAALVAKFTNSSTTGDRTALIDIQNGNNVLWRYGVGGTGNGLGINNGQFYIERAGIGSVLTINTSGNVGIGTNVPDSYYKLSVRGPIRATEVRVNTGWADYVFEKDYRLQPLAEVEAYIKENKHLPDVPSAAEVEQNGINVGEMNAVLLRKIEELTLHLIELKKDNDLLKSKVDQLDSQAKQK